MPFVSLFPDSDYRHHLSLKRGDLARFFAPQPDHAAVIAERNRWLDQNPELYSAALDSAAPIVAEAFAALHVPDENGASAVGSLGRHLEPDIILLEKNADGIFRVVAGCVCFPSSWSFPEKLGQPLDFIHGIVPDLNASIGPAIARFLGKMTPGAVWERSNWGLSASPERNQHPSRQIRRLTLPVTPDRVWLRVEDQILAILPETKALLFSIRIVTAPLAQVREEEPAAAAGLRRALETMPEEMARYKGFSAVRQEVARLL
ncbi:MAG: heme-dependent oxidative N-demethylase subunit alpha family protein [Chthoniobacterales bacterium]